MSLPQGIRQYTHHGKRPSTTRLIGVIAALLLLAGCGTAPAPRPDPPTLSVIEAYYALQAVDDLQTRGIIDADTAAAQRHYYLDAASTQPGETLTREALREQIFQADAGWWRFITFVNIIWLFASLMIVLALGYIFAHYIFPLLKQIPLTFYELLLYAACFGLLYIAWDRFDPQVGQFVAMPSLLGILPLMTWSYDRHVLSRSRQRTSNRRGNERRLLLLQHLMMTGVYVAAALLFDSELIGFFAVLDALLVIVLAGVPELIAFVLRQKRENAIEEIVLIITLAMVLIWVGAEVAGLSGPYLLFEPAVYYIGTYIYFVALEVVASRFYPRERDKFWWWQGVAVISGVGVLFIGVMLEIDTMQETAGTFLLIYLLTKYIEIANWRRYWVWAMLGLGLILYGVALLLNQYPAFFLFG
jgi:hypothetical protein